jgi:hypothetical protein
LSYVIPISAVISLLIASMMLFVNYRNLHTTRLNRENDTIVEIWQKYEKNCADINDAKTGTAKDLAFASMVNYIENTCFLINKNRLTKSLKRASKRMVSDFLDSLEKYAPVEIVLSKIDDAPHAFSEIREFMRQRQKAPRSFTRFFKRRAS